MTGVQPPREQLDLAGRWQLAFDPQNEGVRQGWPTRWPAGAELVQVPALWNVMHPDYEGVAFYRRTFAIPADWSGKALRLHFGGVSYRADIWLNGRYLGSHEGAYTPFWLNVTPVARVGDENELVVRVASLAKGREVDGLFLPQCPASKQSWYYTHGGLWGEVHLEAVAPVFCRDVAVTPDLARECALAEVWVENTTPECRPVEVHLEVTAPGGTVAPEVRSAITLQPGVSCLSYRLPLPRPLPWDLRSPNLYRLVAELAADGGPVDRFSTRFGMREFTVENGRFLLNGEPVLLQGVLLQPDYPITSVVPPTREMMVREITLAKEAGFNLIRAHIRPTPPGYLDLTDELGMLVYAESCLAWIKDSPRLLDHGRRELAAMIQRDRNHPSVVFWGVYNENRPANALTGEALVRFVRALDPTRVIVDNSGGTMAIDQDFGWADRATMVPPWSSERQPVQDLHIYVGAPIPTPVYEWMRTLGAGEPSVDMAAHDFGSRAILDELSHEWRTYRGQVFVSELGCGGLPDLDEVVASFGDQQHLRDAREMRAFRDSLQEGFVARGLDRVFGSVQGLVRASQELQAAGLKRQVESLLANRRVSGYCITQLNDLAWEFHAGLLDHWRRPKRAYEAMRALQRPHCVILKAPSPVETLGQRSEVALTVVNREPLQGPAQVQVAVCRPRQAAQEWRSFEAPSGAGIYDLGTVPVQTADTPGEWRVVARLVRGSEVLAESTETLLALPSVDLTPVPCLGEPLDGFPQAGEDSDADLVLVPRPRTLATPDWVGLLDGVAAGGTAIIGALHQRDELAVRVLNERGIPMRLHYGIGNWMGCYHWIPASGLFAGLPAGGLAGEAYVDVLPWYAMSELGGQVLAGCLRNTQTRFEPPAILWYSDIEVLPYGRGTLVFCQYRIFDKAHVHPLARTLVANLILLGREHRLFTS